MSLSLQNLQALLVESSPMQAKVIEQALHRCGVVNVTVVADCDAALTAMRRQAPSVVISSMYLPDMTGTDLLFAMRKDDDLEWLPFILVSSETRPKMLEPVRQAGACGILPKPFSDEQLRRALYATLELLEEDESLSAMGIEVKHLKVLLVDDSKASRNFIRRILESVGIPECYEANSGTDALMVLENQQVDLIITDYHMPEMNGRDLIEHVRTSGWQQDVPILMVTSEHDSGRLAAVEQAGVSGIFDKPFDPSSVKAMLAQIFSER